MICDLNNASTSAPGTAAARIEHPHPLRLKTKRFMGMPKADHLRFFFRCICKKLFDAAFHTLQMAMRHIKPDTTYFIEHHRRLCSCPTEKIAISRDLMNPQMRIVLSDNRTVLIVISQMNDLVRLHRIHTVAHKASPGMGIRQHKNFHGTPILSSMHIVVQKANLL